MGILQTLKEQDLPKLTLEEKKEIIHEAADIIFHDCILIGNNLDLKPSKVLADTLMRIDKERALQEKKENYELCYFLNEIVWEIRLRLDKIKTEKNDGLCL